MLFIYETRTRQLSQCVIVCGSYERRQAFHIRDDRCTNSAFEYNNILIIIITKNSYQPNFNCNNRNNYPKLNFNNNNRPVQFYKCNESHFSNQCRFNQVQHSNYRMPDNINYNDNSDYLIMVKITLAIIIILRH